MAMTFPNVPLGYRIEVAPTADPTADPDDHDWVDATADLAARIPIRHKRGSADEQGDSSSEASFVFRNPDRRWSTDNPLSDVWPGWNVDCPIRCSISLDGSSTWDELFTQYAAEITDTWGGTSGRLPRTAVRADGVFRRLGQGDRARAALNGTILGDAPIAAWAFSDGSSAQVGGSAISGGHPMRVVSGSPTFGPGVEGLPPGLGDSVTDLTDASMVGLVEGGSASEWSVEFAAEAADAASGALASIAIGTGTWERLDIYAPFAGSSGLQFVTRGGGGAFTGTWSIADGWHHYLVTAEQISTNVTVKVYQDGVLVDTPYSGVGTLGALTEVAMNSLLFPTSTSMYFSDVAVHNQALDATAAAGRYQAMLGYPGEMAHDRIARRLLELGIPSDVTATTSTRLGPQLPGTAMDVLRDAEAADHGQLDDSRGRVAYRALSEMYNQTAALTVDAAAYELGFPLRPVTDDQKLVNRSTVTRTDGTSATVDRSNGSAPRTRDVELNLFDDTQPEHHASFYVSLGEVRGKRVPQISINFAAAPQLAAAFLALRLGDRVTVVNAPLELSSTGTLDLVWVGWATGTYSRRAFWATANCASYEPYRVGVYGIDPGGVKARYDSRYSVLANAVDADDTALVVGQTAGPRWITGSSSPRFPLQIAVDGGLVYSVASIASAATDTFSRSVSNGWGTSTSGHVWSTTGGAAGDYSVNGTRGQVSHSSVSVNRRTVLAVSYPDVDMTCGLRPEHVAIGAPIEMGLVARRLDASNEYFLSVLFTTSATITVRLLKTVGGSTSTIKSTTLADATYTSSSTLSVRYQVQGTRLRVKAWLSGSEPDWWLLDEQDTALSGAGAIGTRSSLQTSNSNSSPVELRWDDLTVLSPQTFTVTRLGPGNDKAHAAGTPVRVHQPGRYALGEGS